MSKIKKLTLLIALALALASCSPSSGKTETEMPTIAKDNTNVESFNNAGLSLSSQDISALTEVDTICYQAFVDGLEVMEIDPYEVATYPSVEARFNELYDRHYESLKHQQSKCEERFGTSSNPVETLYLNTTTDLLYLYVAHTGWAGAIRKAREYNAVGDFESYAGSVEMAQILKEKHKEIIVRLFGYAIELEKYKDILNELKMPTMNDYVENYYGLKDSNSIPRERTETKNEIFDKNYHTEENEAKQTEQTEQEIKLDTQEKVDSYVGDLRNRKKVDSEKEQYGDPGRFVVENFEKLKVSGEKANIRTGPGFDHEISGYWIAGDIVTVYDQARADDRTWYKTHPSKEWWVSERVLSMLRAEDYKSHVPEWEEISLNYLDTVKILADTALIYSEPGIGSPLENKWHAGDYVTLTGIVNHDGEWWFNTHPNKGYWIKGQDIGL